MNVKRYNQEYYHSGDESTLDEAPDGEWVRWDEVEPLLAGIKAERDALKRDIASDQEGALDLRRRFGARADEPFATFVERIVAERDEARALLRELLDCKVWDSGLPGCFSLIVPELMYALIEKAVEVKP